MFHPTFKRALLFLVLKSFLAFVLTLFNFQGTSRSVQRSSSNVSHSTPFVKNFFKFFELYFVLTRVSRDSFVILPPTSSFVKHFSQSFLRFSRLLYNAQVVMILTGFDMFIFTMHFHRTQHFFTTKGITFRMFSYCFETFPCKTFSRLF